ncbi:DUF885 domain-containing protein [Bowmanella dokdonensis]|uniref:DUF885 domain-containing protein n=1 Tax=Bowmanella dokdonensis TaxID=751969 RepID=A0A939DQH7_9ALTE|nr:DUF885 domain-containing protein [Bowmanella dokdonensis]MBN7826925.1 DUF885 domain-containing protein [Bowmanella dokdonensis]
MHKHLIALSVTLALTACQKDAQHPTNTASADQTQSVAAQLQVSPSEQLAQTVDAYFSESLANNPVYATFVGVHDYNDRFSDPISEATLAEQLAFEQKYLKAIQAIDADALSGQDRLSYDIFLRDRKMAIRGFEFNAHMMPFNQMWGVQNFYPMLGSGASAQPFNTLEDYENFIKRTEGFATYMDSAVEAMRQGMEKGVVLPKSIIVKVLPQLQAHIVDAPGDSVFYGPVKALEDHAGFSDEQKARLKKDYEAMIMQVIVPTYRKVHEFVMSEYLPRGRDSVGLSELPNGQAWYEHMIAVNTTLPLSADEIHQFGLDEVSRIRAEMDKVREQVGFEGDLQAFFEHLKTDPKFFFDSPEQVIQAYEQVKADINARLPKLFSIAPEADYEVRAVEAYRAASSAGASYQQPAPDGSRPGIFYINTHDLKSQPKYLLETLSIHEAAPGHHFQIAIQQEVEGLPDFRKFEGYTVFSEGWALYAESLGKELGLFTDPYMWYGRLSDEQLRAMRLVVDTGLHAKGWNREQAMDFMRQNSSMGEADIESEVERYIAIPGQALSYKTGERAIRQLREKLAARMGDKFDLREFHTQVLIDGAMPMPVLEAKLNRWAEQQG